MTRQEARILGKETYRRAKRCPMDGTHVFYTNTGKCVECSAYAASLKAGRIDGVKGNGNDRTIKDKWSEEMRREHSQAIKRGIARKRGLST